MSFLFLIFLEHLSPTFWYPQGTHTYLVDSRVFLPLMLSILSLCFCACKIPNFSCVSSIGRRPVSLMITQATHAIHRFETIWKPWFANRFLYVAGAGATFQIQTQKIEIKAQSKVGSLDNVKHKPGGGEKKIFDDKDYLKNVEHSVALTTPPTQVNYVYISSL